jgi:hypothetical protein
MTGAVVMTSATESSNTKLNQEFTAELRKESGVGGWTYVVWPEPEAPGGRSRSRN